MGRALLLLATGIGAVVLDPRSVVAEGLLLCDEDLRHAAGAALVRVGIAGAFFDPGASRPPPPRAPELLAEAARSYAAMQAVDALARLGAAREELDRSGAAGVSPDDIVRLELLEALARHAVGELDRVDGALARARAVDPDLAVDPVEYPPWLLERVADALRQPPSPQGRLEVRGETAADLWIDGALACSVPCARELAAGPHRIRVERQGRLTHAEVVEIGQEAPATVTAALAVDPEAVVATARRAVAGGSVPVEALALFDPVVVLERRGPELSAVVHRTEGAARSARTAAGPVVEDDLRRLALALAVPPPAPVLPRRRPLPRSPWIEGAWPWIAAGAALVAGGIGLAVLATRDPEDGFSPVVSPP